MVDQPSSPPPSRALLVSPTKTAANRSRSSTLLSIGSSRSESERELYATNPQVLLTPGLSSNVSDTQGFSNRGDSHSKAGGVLSRWTPSSALVPQSRGKEPHDDMGLSQSYQSSHTMRTVRPNSHKNGIRSESGTRRRNSSESGSGSREGSDTDQDAEHADFSGHSHFSGIDKSSTVSYRQDSSRPDPSFIINLTPAKNQADFSGDEVWSSHENSMTPQQLYQTRPRAVTFGGVPIPPSPDLSQVMGTSSHILPSHNGHHLSPLHQNSHRPPLNRTRSSSVTSTDDEVILPSSSTNDLHLGKGFSETFSERRPMLHAGLKAGALFVISLLVLTTVLKTLLPTIDEEHKAAVKLPKSFDDLKALNEVLQIYKERNYWRVFSCFTTVYLFLQAFSIPGSMYLSILAGAMYGVLVALPLVCVCVSTGALLCYFISAALGPAVLLHSSKWQRRVDAWKDRVASHNENLISYLIVLRIAPLPPHWLVNVVAPHLGISIWKFWVSTFFGISGVSYIHTQIGTTLDQMTSSSDFHLMSWQNGLGLGGIVIAVLIPVGLKMAWKKDLQDAAIDDPLASNEDYRPSTPRGSIALAKESRHDTFQTRRQSGYTDDGDDDADGDDIDEAQLPRYEGHSTSKERSRMESSALVLSSGHSSDENDDRESDRLNRKGKHRNDSHHPGKLSSKAQRVLGVGL